MSDYSFENEDAEKIKERARNNFIDEYTQTIYTVLDLCPPLGSIYTPYDLGKRLGSMVRKTEAREYLKKKTPEKFIFQDYVQFASFCIDKPAIVPIVQQIVHSWMRENNIKSL